MGHTVLLVDDHPVMRAGLAMMLDRAPEFSLAGEAGTAAESRELIAKLHPNLVVLDLMLGGRDGVPLIAELLALHPPARILVYSSLDETTYARRALRVGAFGYLMKTENLDAVREALLAIAQGRRVMSESIRESLVAESLGGPEPALDRLSDRELQVLRLVGEGFTLSEIAKELNLSVKTIGGYRERLKIKVGVDSARELAKRAAGFLDAP
ncbi:MAG: response regulator [Chthoniobacterales bacterium]